MNKGAILKEYKFCPVCKSAKREEAPNGIPSRGGESYLVHVSEQLGCTVAELIDQLEVFQCAQCKVFYLDPWLSDLQASKLFTTESPVHRSGWSNLQQWVDQIENADLNRELPGSVLEFVNDQYGEIFTYAEVGCPFQGYLLRLSENSTSDSQTKFLQSLKLPRLDKKFSTFPRIYRDLERLLSHFFVLMLKIRKLKRGKPNHVRTEIEIPIVEKTLFVEDSLYRWGANCNAYGQSCKYFAQSCLGVHVSPIDYGIENRQTFDLIGIHNSLDHSTNPIGLLTKCLQMSQMVLITGHRNKSSAKQHHFAFSDASIEIIAELIGNVNVTDIGSELDISQNSESFFYLIRRI
jgi:hypothetical protein